MSFTIEVSELPESITEFKPIPGHRARMGMEALAITSTEKQAEDDGLLQATESEFGFPHLHSGRHGDHGGRDGPSRRMSWASMESIPKASSLQSRTTRQTSTLSATANVTYLWPRHKG